MSAICRVLFVSILIASAVSTARAEAHEAAGGDSGMPDMPDMPGGEEMQKLAEAVGKMMECQTTLGAECPALASMMADAESNPDADSYPATEEEFDAICGDACQPAMKGLTDCLKDAADGLTSLMESGGEDMKEMEDGMKEMDAMSGMIKETCETCAWDDHPCMDQIEAKYNGTAVDTGDDEDSDDGSSDKATIVSAALMAVVSFAFFAI